MDITMPQLGESVTEGTILRWYKSVGEPIEADEVLFEVATDKVDAEVPSPVAGVLTAIRVPEGATVAVGAVLAVVDGAVSTPRPGGRAEPTPEPSPSLPLPPPPMPTPTAVTHPATDAPSPPVSAGGSPLASPLARRILREAGLHVSDVNGTGRRGRVTRADAERAAASRRTSTTGASGPAAMPTTPPPSPPPGPPSSESVTSPAAASTRAAVGGDSVVPMNRIRQRTAAHMVASRSTSPHALVATEVRYDAVERTRQSHRDGFRLEEETSLTYLPFIARATVDALRQFPAVNASVTGDGEAPASNGTGDGLTFHREVNLAIAVDLNFDGLVAPVVHRADDYRLRALARRMAHAARRARRGELGPDDLTGGTFTISNSGSFGTHLVIPIINQPQVAILCTDAVRRRPVVVTTDDGDEAIGISSVGLLALSWDQRAFDGAYASAFLDEVRRILETRDWEVELR